MFTGLIACRGKIQSVQTTGMQTRLVVSAKALGDFISGESIALCGVCLTVESFGTDWFSAYASAETIKRTTLGTLGAGSVVNLERALAIGGRLGGHIVSGHTDCVAEVVSLTPQGESRVFRLAFPEAYAPFVIEKGSVALDGISLTINACAKDWLEVNVIPETWKVTTVSAWAAGVKVNMETDIIGKYVEHMLTPWADNKGIQGTSSAMSMDFLRKHGF